MASVPEEARRQGWAAAVHALWLKALSVCGVKVLRGVAIERPDPKFLQCPGEYRPGFLPGAKLRAYASNPRTRLGERFLDRALAAGDECYAFRHGEALAAYGWYAFGRTPVDLVGMCVSFRPDYVYMYKGFTDPGHRGRRLHAIGMTRALEHYRRRGYRGIVSYVEATNRDSLKSCLRMGYRVFGSIYVLRLFGARLAWSSPGCRPFAFRLVAIPPGRSAAAPAQSAR